MKYAKVTYEDYGYYGSYVHDPREYLALLPELRERLPAGAWAFASDPEHYDFHSSRRIKDLKLGSMEFSRREDGKVIVITFLPGRFTHDESLAITYSGVYSYEAAVSRAGHGADAQDDNMEDLGDVRIDEILPHEHGCSHEIELIGGRILIVCRDLAAVWQDAE